jgi:H+/Cl- antiporter ClcA
MVFHPRTAVKFKRELLNWRLWSGRLIVLIFAAFTGLLIVSFTKLAEFAFECFGQMTSNYWWLPLVLTPIVTITIVYLTRKIAPGAAGSGIPQVIAALDNKCPPDKVHFFVSLKLSFSKILLTSFGLFAGLSLGREGPSVQVAAGIMRQAKKLFPVLVQVSESSLIMAGGAAGIAAAFNTPLGGVMFAIEELSKSLEQKSNGLLLASIILAGLIGVSINGNATYFNAIHEEYFSWKIIGISCLVTITSGILGGIFSKLLIISLKPSKHYLSSWRINHPLLFAGICGLLVALIGVISNGETYGTGYGHTQSAIAGTDSSLAFVPLKFLATWLTTWSGVPAGIFAPSLAIGGGVGKTIADLMLQPHSQILIAVGMAGFLAAVTQAPLTSFVIVMEMVDGHGLVLSLMASALLAAGISRLISKPLYPTLAKIQLMRIQNPIK